MIWHDPSMRCKPHEYDAEEERVYTKEDDALAMDDADDGGRLEPLPAVLFLPLNLVLQPVLLTTREVDLLDPPARGVWSKPAGARSNWAKGPEPEPAANDCPDPLASRKHAV